MADEPSLVEMLEADEAKAVKDGADTPKDEAKDDDAAPPPAEAVTDETPDETPEEKPTDEPAKTNDDYSIRDYAKELLGEDAHSWIETFKDDDAFVKGYAEAQRLIGRRNQDSDVVKWLETNGVTAQDLQALIAGKGSNGKPASENGEWRKDWVTVTRDGKWVPTAKAPANIDKLIEERQLLMAQAFAGDTEAARKLLPHLGEEIEAKTAAATKDVEARFAAEKQQREFQDWSDLNRGLLFLPDSDDLSPLGRTVNERLKSGKINPTLSWREQAEDALEWAKEKAKPQIKKPVVPAGAKHQAAPAKGTPKKMTDDEFFEKYGDNLGQFAQWKETGEVPVTA